MTLSTKVFVSSDRNNGFGVTSTIIMGRNDAILVDTQFTISNAYRLVAEIIETGKELKVIYITHLHPDHYLGLAVIKSVFPFAEVVSSASIADEINDAFDFKIDYWGKSVLKKNGAREKVLIQPLSTNKLHLDRNEIIILNDMCGDCINISPLWIPSIKTIIASDIVFSDVHIWIADMRNNERIQAWMHSLDILEGLSADKVIPGHSSLQPTLSPSAISFTRQYIKDFLKANRKSNNSVELIKEMKRIYPQLTLDICLEYSAKIINDKICWPGDWPLALREMRSTL
ncbi:MBL fold metallo-hydrolase [Citrobacter sp. Cb004]|uniref:MBL fold metallo-hydrolase n=1 Tax=Citrobacter sp. Cb004 TaxID=2985006 RepID=UPI0025779AEC|nr:MBL fold metallo-hydrolase [Citrobacter sp. Cb004]MDM3357002.1 MBL fold metallo-hydrolase [Citrobacter sp. Cb004]